MCLDLLEERPAIFGIEEDYFMFDQDVLGRNMGISLNPRGETNHSFDGPQIAGSRCHPFTFDHHEESSIL